MSLPPPPDVEIVGPAKTPPRQLTLSIHIDRAALPSTATALGVALVSAAVVTSAIYSRHSGSLDMSNYVMGVLGTVGLLGFAIGAYVRAPASQRGTTLVSWPGAAGIVGAGAMLAVAINDDPGSVYALGGAVLVLSASVFLVTRAAPFTLTAIAGAALLYGQGFGDVIGTGTSDIGSGTDTSFIRIGAAILVFVALVTGLGWLLPETRVLTGVVTGVGGLVAMTALFVALVIAGSFAGIASGFSATAGPGGSAQVVAFHNPFSNDIWTVLGYSAALVLFWLACSAITGHVGFRILAIVLTLIAVPATTFALSARHPTWWEVVTCGLGGLVLVWVAFRSTGTAEAQ
ncbi:MAG: hypothetical protein JWQ32_3144 [Marmoricola sp.]|nr:hypothetical protein [Marmoricola sp.]